MADNIALSNSEMDLAKVTQGQAKITGLSPGGNWYEQILLLTRIDPEPSDSLYLLSPTHLPFPPHPNLSSSCREVSEPSAAAVTEVEPDSESSVAQQPPAGAEPENSEGRLEEVRSLIGWGCLGLCLSPTNLHPHSYKSMCSGQHRLRGVT